MTSSIEIRSAIADLEAAAHAAGQRLAAAETAHQVAMRSSILANTPEAYAGIADTEAELAAARVEGDRAFAALATARTMLAEALAAEKLARRDAARAQAEAKIAEMLALGEEADADFAALCAKLCRIRGMEMEARTIVHHTFERSPPGGPTAYGAADRWASHLKSRYEGLRPDPKPAVAVSLQSGISLIREGMARCE